MILRTALLTALLLQTTGCIRIYDFSSPEKLTFDYVPAVATPVTYADLMCCYDCAV